jgi:hypothetical protein
MKKLTVIILCLLAINVKAQVFDCASYFIWDNQYPCGTWKPDSGKLTNWQSIDTLKKPVITNDRNWVEDAMQTVVSPYANTIYCPCGCGDNYVRYQYRICSITGIRQKRYFIITYHYIDPEKSDYEKTIDKFH